jgi:hypothetical protein
LSGLTGSTLRWRQQSLQQIVQQCGGVCPSKKPFKTIMKPSYYYKTKDMTA